VSLATNGMLHEPKVEILEFWILKFWILKFLRFSSYFFPLAVVARSAATGNDLSIGDTVSF
jgi:hypothetical protein